MRRGFGFLGLVLTTILLIVVGVIAYQAGWSEGVATHLPDSTTAAAVPYYYGPHFFGFGFGLFWIFGLFLFLFLVGGLFRIARFGRMGGGYGGYKHWGYQVPPAVDERMQEWHKRAHGEPVPAPPTDTKQV
jgi:hypothetical protein